MKSIKKLLLFAVLGICIIYMSCDNLMNNGGDVNNDDFVEGVDDVITGPSNVDLNTKQVPPGPTLEATQDELFKFAWEQFIALNWPAADQTTAGNRAKPSSDPSATFASIESGNTPPVVWHTYVSKAEAFGPDNNAAGTLPAWSELGLPNYSYEEQPQLDPGVNYQLFNNLDENNEIGEAFVWGGAGLGDTIGGNQVLYEAKFNKTEYDYIHKYGLNNAGTRKNWKKNSAIEKKVNGKKVPDPKGEANLEKFGGTCDVEAAAAKNIFCFPCTDGTSSQEGVIEIKAGWRELITGVDDFNRYYTQDVIIYEEREGEKYAVNKTYALIGLHIIRKTEAFPTFIFTTFNHVDNIQTGIRFKNESAAVGGFTYFKDSLGTIVPVWDTIPQRIPSGKAILNQGEIHTIQDELKVFNSTVQKEINTANANSVWQYYELLGVQATPTDISGADADPTYYLANNVIETDHVLTRFTSRLHKAYGILLNKSNIFYQEPGLSATGAEVTAVKKVSMGGCKGCHGNAQISGSDFSFLMSSSVLKEADAIGTSNDKK